MCRYYGRASLFPLYGSDRTCDRGLVAVDSGIVGSIRAEVRSPKQPRLR